MEFTQFTELVSKVKKIPLEGEKAHSEMAPESRKEKLSETEINRKKPMEAGVMALFYPNKDNETMLILILRKTYKGVHSGQIGFPGGRVERRDTDLEDTALRETYEEIGVRGSNVNVIKKLTKIYIPPSNFWVHPYLGYTKNPPKFRRQESEVEELLQIKLEDFLNDDNVFTATLSTSKTKNISVPAFDLNDQTVWGATAMMLNEVKSLLLKAL